VADDFGGKPWQGRPKGNYWLAADFHTWPEIRSLRLTDLGLFVESGIWTAAGGRDRFVSREIAGYGRGRVKVAELVNRGLWTPVGRKLYTVRTMAELRMGRGRRGPIMHLSRRLPVSVETAKSGLAAFAVYALAASWSLSTPRPGFIPTEAGLRFGKPRHLAALWDSGLWLARGDGFCMNLSDHPLEAWWRVGRDDQRAAIPADVRERVMNTFGGRCARCGATEGLALDHIYPWSLGGTDDEENLQVLCTPCNSAKGARIEEKGAA
jgi:hypothetical protein